MSKEVDTDCAVTALALPYGGRVLFAGTETGAVRGYRYPLTGEFYEVSACQDQPLTQPATMRRWRMWRL